MVNNQPANAGDTGWEGPLEEGMATLSSILAWRIPWTEVPGIDPKAEKKTVDLNQNLYLGYIHLPTHHPHPSTTPLNNELAPLRTEYMS